jgi:3-oxoacid CoA-transferase subunit A
MSLNKIFENASHALDGILFDGMTILSGGFGVSGIAENLTEEIKNSKVKELTCCIKQLWN